MPHGPDLGLQTTACPIGHFSLTLHLQTLIARSRHTLRFSMILHAAISLSYYCITLTSVNPTEPLSRRQVMLLHLFVAQYLTSIRSRDEHAWTDAQHTLGSLILDVDCCGSCEEVRQSPDSLDTIVHLLTRLTAVPQCCYSTSLMRKIVEWLHSACHSSNQYPASSALDKSSPTLLPVTCGVFSLVETVI